MSLQTLPEDICLYIINLLDFKCLFNVTLISKKWQSYFNNKHIWYNVLKNTSSIKISILEQIKYLSFKDIVRLIIYFKDIEIYHSTNEINPYVLQGINFIKYKSKFLHNVMGDIMFLYLECNRDVRTNENNLMFYMMYPEVFKILIKRDAPLDKTLYSNTLLCHAIDNNDILAIELILENMHVEPHNKLGRFVAHGNNPLSRAMSNKKYLIIKLLLEKAKSNEFNQDDFKDAMDLAFSMQDKYIIDLMMKHKFFHPYDLSIRYIPYIREHLDILIKILDHSEFSTITTYNHPSLRRFTKEKETHMCHFIISLFEYACLEKDSPLFNLLIKHPKVDPSLGSEFFLKYDLDIDHILNHKLGVQNAHRLIYHISINNRPDLLLRLVEIPEINFNNEDINQILIGMKEDFHFVFRILLVKISKIRDFGKILPICVQKPGCLYEILKLPSLKYSNNYNFESFLTMLCHCGSIESFNVLIQLRYNMKMFTKKYFIHAVESSNKDIALELYKLDHIKEDCLYDKEILKVVIRLKWGPLFKIVLNDTLVTPLEKLIIDKKEYWNSEIFDILLRDPRLNMTPYMEKMLYVAVREDNFKCIKHILTNVNCRAYVRISNFLDFCDKRFDLNLDVYVRDIIYNKIRYTSDFCLDSKDKLMIKRILGKLKLQLSNEEYSILKQIRRIALWLGSEENIYIFSGERIDESADSFYLRLELEAIQFRTYENVCREIMGNDLYELYTNKRLGWEPLIYIDACNLNLLGARNIIRMIQAGKFNFTQDITIENITQILNIKSDMHILKAKEELLVKYGYAVRLLNRYKNRYTS